MIFKNFEEYLAKKNFCPLCKKRLFAPNFSVINNKIYKKLKLGSTNYLLNIDIKSNHITQTEVKSNAPSNNFFNYKLEESSDIKSFGINFNCPFKIINANYEYNCYLYLDCDFSKFIVNNIYINSEFFLIQRQNKEIEQLFLNYKNDLEKRSTIFSNGKRTYFNAHKMNFNPDLYSKDYLTRKIDTILVLS